jgi:hypothetical protein
VKIIAAGETWRATVPNEGALWLSGPVEPWWVAGGWALDLFVGHQSRSHKDLDIGIFWCDAVGVLPVLDAVWAPQTDALWASWIVIVLKLFIICCYDR